MNIFFVQFIVIIFLGILFHRNQLNKRRNQYIILVSIMLVVLCGFRAQSIGADMGVYLKHYKNCIEWSWSELFAQRGEQNVLYYSCNKIFGSVLGLDFQYFKFIVSLISVAGISHVIKKYSNNVMMSYAVYIALGYYVFTFSGMKQTIATAVLCVAFDKMMQKKPKSFILCVLIAGLFHMPALIFLPAYWICSLKLNYKTAILFIGIAALLMLFKGKIVEYLTLEYQSVVNQTESSGVGGKVVVMTAMLIFGYLFRRPSPDNRQYQILFNMMIIATLIQLLAVYGNVFERLSDYYFVFSFIYIPQAFFNNDHEEKSIIVMDNKGMKFVQICFIGLLSVYYLNILHDVYGLFPYKFFWQ